MGTVEDRPGRDAGVTGVSYRERMAQALRGKPRGEIELEHGLLGAVGIVRWVALLWMLALAGWEWAQGDSITQPAVVGVLCVAATAFTVWATVMLRVHPEVLLVPSAVVIEVVIAVTLGVADGYAFDGTQSQHFGSAWPLASVLTAGIAFGLIAGLGVGAVVGLAGLGGELVSSGLRQTTVSAGVVSSGVLYALAGGASGLATSRLRAAERALAVAQAREEVARALHDGVLQTLAVVQRRSDDDELVALAAEQERELRDYLFGARARTGTTEAGPEVVDGLRQAAARAERVHGLRVQVVVAGALPPWMDQCAPAVIGAVAEALTNASKHGHADTATVFVEETDEGDLFCSVKDSGVGFEPDGTTEGIGLTRSIRARISEVGGDAEIQSRPGSGTEIRLRVHPPDVRSGGRRDGR